jgi:hypothetical protein
MISIPLLEIRTLDMCALLLAGLLLEILTRVVLLMVKSKSQKELRDEVLLFQLNQETIQKRRMGPSYFVETSKLERQVLSKEKALEKIVELRKTRTERIKKLVKNASLVFYGLCFLTYYSLPILSIDGTRIAEDSIVTTPEEEHDRATAFLQGFLFPLSYVGFGNKVARFGLPTPGFGALMVLWSAQVTVGKLMDGLELLFL